MEKQAQPADGRPRRELSTKNAIVAGVLVATLTFTWLSSPHSLVSLQNAPPHSVVEEVQTCAIANLHKDLSFLAPAVPITAKEFIDRRDRLAKALAASSVDAFVLEPGYTFQYYGNISQVDWGM